jgi:hypothetical protein
LWLTPRRLRAHAIILALSLWGVCAVDFLTPGPFDRAGNIKFQDFLSFYISARLIQQGRAAELYDQPARDAEMLSIIRTIDAGQRISAPPSSAYPRLPNLYGPQTGLLFVPLTRFSFPTAALLWVTLSVLIYLGCLYFVWKSCVWNVGAGRAPLLAGFARRDFLLVAIAFPPLFHFFVRGQLSVPVLVCFTLAYLAFRSHHVFLAGIALGLLILKPQFLLAIPLVLLLSHAWKAFAGLLMGAFAQLAITWARFGSAVMHSYVEMLHRTPRWLGIAEPVHSRIQMHSLRSFWSLLIPSPSVAFVLFLLSSIVVVWISSCVWKSSAALSLRFSALTLAAVLVNPHLLVYDLLVLAPILLLLAGWTLANATHPYRSSLRVLIYLAFVLPLFGPLTQWTHLQLSVLAFVALLWVLSRVASRTASFST